MIFSQSLLLYNMNVFSVLVIKSLLFRRLWNVEDMEMMFLG